MLLCAHLAPCREHVPLSLQSLLCAAKLWQHPSEAEQLTAPLPCFPHPVLDCMQSSWLPPSVQPYSPPRSPRPCSLQDGGLGLSASWSSSEAQSAYAALLEQAVSQLQLLGAGAGASTSSRKAHQAAQDRLYGLLEALAQVGATTWSLLFCVCVSVHSCATTCLPLDLRLSWPLVRSFRLRVFCLGW